MSMKRVRSLMEDQSVRHDAKTEQHWQPTPSGSRLIAWDASKEPSDIVQTRLYLTEEHDFLVYEQRRGSRAIGTPRARIRRRVLNRQAARELYRRLHIHTVPETDAFDT